MLLFLGAIIRENSVYELIYQIKGIDSKDMHKKHIIDQLHSMCWDLQG